MLEELKGACAQAAQTDSKALAEGPLVAHIGYPAPAAPGTVALKLADVVTVIREADIVRVRKHKSLYQVWTSTDANVIVRLEKVFKAAGEPAACGCEDTPPSDSLAREIGLDIGEITVTPVYCKTQRICTTVFGRAYCYNVVVCRPIGGGDPTSWPEEE